MIYLADSIPCEVVMWLGREDVLKMSLVVNWRIGAQGKVGFSNALAYT